MADLRTQIVHNIEREFIGPGSEGLIEQDFDHEVITENPLYRYSTGVVLPFEGNLSQIAVDEDDDVEKIRAAETSEMRGVNPNADDNHDDTEDEKVSEVDRFPKRYTMGLSCFISSTSKAPLQVTLTCGLYRRISHQDYHVYLGDDYEAISQQIEAFISHEPGDRLNGKIAFEPETQSIRLSVLSAISKAEKLDDAAKDAPQGIRRLMKDIVNKLQSKDLYQREPVQENVSFLLTEASETSLLDLGGKTVKLVSSMTEIAPKLYSVKVILENNGVTDDGYAPELYQPCLEITSGHGNAFYDFERINLARGNISDVSELESLMLYSDKKSYAVGSFTSADWEVDDLGNGRVYTTFLPTSELPALDFEIPAIESALLLASNYTSVATKDSIEKHLKEFVRAYEEWIDTQESEIPDLAEEFHEIAAQNIAKCRFAVTRMSKAIEFLMTDDEALEAFQFGHEAMILQRMSGDVTNRGKFFESKNYSEMGDGFAWRPFQLAFILANFESLLNPESTERDLVDLIWVATGGGKTETYLFAIAALILYRRSKYHLPEDKEGVTVMMRYTLRLLTAQQFDRASALICALEYIRRQLPERFGKKEISIGLWIGGGSTPNRHTTDTKTDLSSNTIIDGLRNATTDFKEKLEENKMQVLVCPWCHDKHSMIPEQPGLMAKWGYQKTNLTNRKNPQTKNFNCTNPSCDFHGKGKELPIYVVDELIYRERPTLIFGTVDKFAMIALKDETIGLFGNDIEGGRNPELVIQDELHLISGPLGTTVGLYESAIDYALSYKGIKPKIIASTATIKNADQQVKSLYNRDVFQFPPQALRASDSFFVTETREKPGRLYLGLTNSNRSLVKLQSKFIAATMQYTQQLEYEKPEDEDKYWTLVGYFNRIVDVGRTNYLIQDIVKQNQKDYVSRNGSVLREIHPVEITSKVKSGKIPDILRRLELPKTDQDGVSIVSASNMISVGLDVSRLNHMYVMSQPKSASEYIQATSRVGRRDPGIVTVLLNGLNARDLSNYERFVTIHGKIYQNVESASVTPFSSPSIQRSLHGVVVAMLRNTVVQLHANAAMIDFENHRNDYEAASNYLMNRAASVDLNGMNYRKNVTTYLQTFETYWSELIDDTSIEEDELRYTGTVKQQKGVLLTEPYETYQSMRDVEAPSLLGRKESYGKGPKENKSI